MTTAPPTKDEDSYLQYYDKLRKKKLATMMKDQLDTIENEEEAEQPPSKTSTRKPTKQPVTTTSSTVDPAAIPNLLTCKGCKKLCPAGDFFFKNNMRPKCSACRELDRQKRASKKTSKDSAAKQYAMDYHKSPEQLVAEGEQERQRTALPPKRKAKSQPVSVEEDEDEEDQPEPVKPPPPKKKAKSTTSSTTTYTPPSNIDPGYLEYMINKKFEEAMNKYSLDTEDEPRSTKGRILDPYSHVRGGLRQDPEASIARLHRGNGPKGAGGKMTGQDKNSINMTRNSAKDGTRTRSPDPNMDADEETLEYVKHLEKRKGGALSASDIEQLLYC